MTQSHHGGPAFTQHRRSALPSTECLARLAALSAKLRSQDPILSRSGISEITATREVVDRREAVPVAWRYRDARNVKSKWTVQKNRPDWWKGDGPDGYILEPLYAHPPQPCASVVEAAQKVSDLWDNGCHDISWRGHFYGAMTNLKAALRALKGDE